MLCWNRDPTNDHVGYPDPGRRPDRFPCVAKSCEWDGHSRQSDIPVDSKLHTLRTQVLQLNSMVQDLQAEIECLHSGQTTDMTLSECDNGMYFHLASTPRGPIPHRQPPQLPMTDPHPESAKRIDAHNSFPVRDLKPCFERLEVEGGPVAPQSAQKLDRSPSPDVLSSRSHFSSALTPRASELYERKRSSGMLVVSLSPRAGCSSGSESPQAVTARKYQPVQLLPAQAPPAPDVKLGELQRQLAQGGRAAQAAAAALGGVFAGPRGSAAAAQPALTAALEDRLPTVRRASAEALGDLGAVASPAAIAALCRASELDASEEVRMAAVKALAQLSLHGAFKQ